MRARLPGGQRVAADLAQGEHDDAVGGLLRLSTTASASNSLATTVTDGVPVAARRARVMTPALRVGREGDGRWSSTRMLGVLR